MSKPRRDKDCLADILEAIRRILDYTQGLSYADFLDSRMVQDAVLRNIQIIGEASKKLSETVKTLYPDMPWREMSGMRDKIVHDYFGVDYQIVWSVAKRDLPDLLSRIEAVFSSLPENE